MDLDKLIKKHRALVILGVLLLAFLAIWFGVSGGQRTEIDFSPEGERGFRIGEADGLGAGPLRSLPFDGAGIDTNAE